MQPEILIAICVAVVIVFALLMGILSRYRKCPSDKILVIYGKVGSDKNGQARSAKCVHGGGTNGEDNRRYNQIKSVIEFAERFIPYDLGSAYMCIN